LINYAGYKNPDGTILGDPANVEFTEVLEYLYLFRKSSKLIFNYLYHKNGKKSNFLRKFSVRKEYTFQK